MKILLVAVVPADAPGPTDATAPADTSAPVGGGVDQPYGGNVRVAPELLGAPADELGRVLVESAADVLIHPGPVAAAALTRWRQARPGRILLALLGSPVVDPAPARDLRIKQYNFPIDPDRPELALSLAERLWNDEQVRVGAGPLVRSADRRVTLVGAGAVNLVTALRFVRSGYDVTVYDAAPDPRRNLHWREYGCTRGGGDGRMFTLTEADSYNGRSRDSTGAATDLLHRPISEVGWGIARPAGLDAADQRWAADFQGLPPWLGMSFNADIFQVSRRAATIWEDLIRANPELFDKHTGYQDGILRLYDDADYFAWHVARNEALGAIRRVLTRDEVAEDYPGLEDACTGGVIAAGLEVVGFTVNIHRFVAHLVDLLERAGVQFHWDQRVTGIRWLRPGLADGVETAAGPVRDTHLVLSPGAYGGGLLAGTASAGEIQGMLGAWLTVPNSEPRLAHSLKIARKGHRAEESNVTLAEDGAGNGTLICGSGYGWTGRDPENIDPAQLESLFDAVTDTIRRFFPRAHAAAESAGTLTASRRYCIRPWTASCLGVFEQVRTSTGHSLIVTGGHNTGGFAQSPAVAEAVQAAVEGEEHDMHRRYAPGRLDRFYRS